MDRKPPEQKQVGAPLWLATYGDMVTLLLTFFVLLYSFSSVDAEKWKQIVQAFTGVSVFEASAPGKPFGQYGDESVIPVDGIPIIGQSGRWDALIEDVERFAKESGGQVGVEYSDFEIVIRLSDSVLFDSAKADLKPEAVPILDKLVNEVIRANLGSLSTIRIEGHTDNRSINTPRFPDNWMLSSVRAYEVRKYMADSNPDIDRSLFCIAGYGEERPVATNDTAEGRAKNRRVDFVLVRPLEALDAGNS